MKFRIIVFVAGITVVCMAAGTQAADPHSCCRICGMYLDVYHRTVATAVSKTETEHTCGVADLVRLIDAKGGPNAFSRINGP
ncbi:MAG: hypothetical protein GXP58_06400 [Deltaproteobacteria bacterium]|nr:hypothetical protein [Deltaproteobacteria bacterium]